MRDHEPGLHRHSLRVGKLVNDLHHYCGLDYSRGWDLVEGALLHDVGKLCLPASILTKPKALSETEKRMVALHPSIGAELLEAQCYFGKRVVDIVRHHHERLDGSGYPNAWRKQRTAKVVRVVAVCDALCALTENRPYEEAWPMPEALERLKSMPDQYDQEPVSLLETMFTERRTSIQFDGKLSPSTQRSPKRSSGVLRPRSAFYAPRTRGDRRTIQ